MEKYVFETFRPIEKEEHMVQTIDLKQLGAIIEERSQTAIEQMLYRDMFAMACYLSINGNKIAAEKLCRTLFEHLGFHNRKTYFLSVMDTLHGNEQGYRRAIEAHSEIDALFERKGSDSSSAG